MLEPPELLVAEDSATARLAATTRLRGWGFAVHEAADGEEAWARLQAPDAPRLALLDWEMPGRSGVELCRLLREREAGGAAYTYVILLTVRGRKDDLVAGMEAGADDYVVKPFDELELRARVRAGQRIVDLQSELYRLKEDLLLQSRTDPLTGTLNRRAVMERLASELSRIRRAGGSLGLGLVDVDHFKPINDTHGHAAGDAVLCEVARRLGAGIRGEDTHGRIGGDEFLVVWAGVDGAGLLAAAERTREHAVRGPFEIPGGTVRATVSIGATTAHGDDAIETILARADRALYVAKANGRGRVEVAAPG